MQEFTVDADSAGKRIDIFLAQQMPKYSRSTLAKFFDGRVMVNGVSSRHSYKIKVGDKVLIDKSKLEQELPVVELPVIFEDDNVAVIDKPAGVLTHSKGSINEESTVASFIKQKYNLGPGEDLTNKSGIVHRLDRDTSGVIITAKNSASQRYLQQQFSGRKVIKVYIAQVVGSPETDEAIIDAPIARNPKKPQSFQVSSAGKSAQTNYKTLKSNHSSSLVELNPKTGRTHQLRVHMSYIGNPIVGDRIYGREGKRLMLHAQSLTLKLPDGELRTFHSKPSDVFDI